MKKALQITKAMTLFEERSFNKYLEEVSKYPLLTTEAETELGVLASGGDKEAIDKLVKHNLRFVITVANQYRNNLLRLPDLVTEGNIGLQVAAERYDPTRGFKFISYAVWYVRKQMLEYISSYGRVVRIPNTKINQIGKLKRMAIELERKLEREPNVDELCDYNSSIDESINLSDEMIKHLMAIEGRTHSLDTLVGDDSNTTHSDMMQCSDDFLADNMLMTNNMAETINEVLKILKSRDRQIIELCFGLNGITQRNNKEIANMMSVSGETIRQIKLKSIKRLYNALKNVEEELF